jgi:DNA-binding XRE family transcriptional regulator
MDCHGADAPRNDGFGGDHRPATYSDSCLSFYVLSGIISVINNYLCFQTHNISMKTLPDLGTQYQALRKQAGMTQLEVAAAAGLRQEALSRFERGRGADFSLAKMLRLAQVLGYDLDLVSARKLPTLDDVLQERKAQANTGPLSR